MEESIFYEVFLLLLLMTLGQSKLAGQKQVVKIESLAVSQTELSPKAYFSFKRGPQERKYDLTQT